MFVTLSCFGSWLGGGDGGGQDIPVWLAGGGAVGGVAGTEGALDEDVIGGRAAADGVAPDCSLLDLLMWVRASRFVASPVATITTMA